jgi:hypothetical protein
LICQKTGAGRALFGRFEQRTGAGPVEAQHSPVDLLKRFLKNGYYEVPLPGRPSAAVLLTRFAEGEKKT